MIGEISLTPGNSIDSSLQMVTDTLVLLSQPAWPVFSMPTL